LCSPDHNKASTTGEMAQLSATAPAKSMLRRVGVRAMCKRRCTNTIDARPMGRLMKKTHRQLR